MIVGTAGHVDHGKTALVKALTGIDTDRLAEEKARGVSIELGFAYSPLASGDVLGFVDVPGHERFMRTMLAGASGIDFALLVVAADDGVMPQTREHLAVIELLGIARGAVALTKCDLVDERRAEAVEAEIRSLAAGGALAQAPVFRTSSRTGAGVGALRQALEQAAAEAAEPDGAGPLRFAVDRSFSLAGPGTVVTGVVMAGCLAVGDTVRVSPSGRSARVRALHVQNRPARSGRKGQRCGVNLAGIAPSDVARGDFLLAPELHAPTDRIDAGFRLLPDGARPLRHWQPVRLHHAAAEVAARVALLEDEPIVPGESGRVQLVLERTIAAAIGDRFVLRDQEGRRTLGGGRLIDLRPPQRRRKQPRRRSQIDAMALEDPGESLAAQLRVWPHTVSWHAFVRDHALPAEHADAALRRVAPELAAVAEETWLFAPETWQRLTSAVLAECGTFHERRPQLLGLSAAKLTAAMEPRLPAAAADAVLARMVAEGLLAREGGMHRLPAHRLSLDRGDEGLWQRIEPLLGGEARFRPPRCGDIARTLGAREFDCRRVLKAMARQERVTEIAPDHFFLRVTLSEIAGIVGELGHEDAFGAAALRDRLDNGRKVAIQLLEWFDRQGLTLRRGDVRIIDPRRLQRFLERREATMA